MSDHSCYLISLGSSMAHKRVVCWHNYINYFLLSQWQK